MSIADDIEKAMEMHAKYLSRTDRHNLEDDLEPAMILCDLAPRLARWAEQVMPPVEAAEEFKTARAEMRAGIITEAIEVAHRNSMRKLLDAALALNLEVPR